jgi:hypothetical protein
MRIDQSGISRASSSPPILSNLSSSRIIYPQAPKFPKISRGSALLNSFHIEMDGAGHGEVAMLPFAAPAAQARSAAPPVDGAAKTGFIC